MLWMNAGQFVALVLAAAAALPLSFSAANVTSLQQQQQQQCASLAWLPAQVDGDNTLITSLNIKKT